MQGKIVRLYPDGGVPKDNPFVGRADARPEIWSYGHRNQQGAALNPWTGRLWTHEHGPRGGDEINIPQAGGNYGWPLATHGINYTLLPIPEARGKAVEGTEAPHHVWEKSPAISGMAFYDAQRFPAWQHNLFIGALATQELIRLQLDGGSSTKSACWAISGCASATCGRARTAISTCSPTRRTGNCCAWGWRASLQPWLRLSWT